MTAASKSSVQAIATGGPMTVTGWTVVLDTPGSSFNPVTGIWTVYQTRTYNVDAMIQFDDYPQSYEKRIREFLEEAFVLAGMFDDVPLPTYAGICAAAARSIAARLVLHVP